MKLKFLVDHVTPAQHFRAGVVCEIPEAEAERLIAEGKAEAATKPKPKAKPNVGSKRKNAASE